MGSFLQGLGALASAAGGALEGYGIDKRERVKAALVQAAEERAIEDQKIQRAAASQALKFGNFNALLQARSAGYRTPEENTGQLQQNLAPSFGPGLGGMGVSLPEDLPKAMQLTRGRGQMLDVPGQDMPMQFNATQTPDALKAEIERRSYERDQRGFAVRDAAQAKTAEGVARQRTTDDAAAATLLAQRTSAQHTADEDPWATTNTTDPETGQVIFYNKKDPTKTVLMGAAKGAGRGNATGGALAMMVGGRFAEGKNLLESSHKRMIEVENELNAGTKQITPEMQGLAAIWLGEKDAKVGGLNILPSNISAGFAGWSAGKAGAKLAKDYPWYQNYLKDNKAVSAALLVTLPRGTREILHLEEGISGVDAGWNPLTILAAQSRRQGALDYVFNNPNIMKSILPPGYDPKTSGANGTISDPNLTKARQLWDAASPALRQQMGPRP